MKIFDEILIKEYTEFKKTDKYMEPFLKKSPLVSICVATWNRSDLLIERSLPSILNQTYQNIEIIVIGDCCNDDTVERIKEIKDPRLFFYNRKKRKNYLIDKVKSKEGGAWCIGGIYAVNLALLKAKGDFITHLDDDDEMLSNKIEDLVKIAQEKKVDYICHGFDHQNYLEKDLKLWGRKDFQPGSLKWYSKKNVENGKFGHVTTGSQFYHNFFKKVKWDIECSIKRNAPGDWDRYMRILEFKPNIYFHNEILMKHYLEMQNVSRLLKEEENAKRI